MSIKLNWNVIGGLNPKSSEEFQSGVTLRRRHFPPYLKALSAFVLGSSGLGQVVFLFIYAHMSPFFWEIVFFYPSPKFRPCDSSELPCSYLISLSWLLLIGPRGMLGPSWASQSFSLGFLKLEQKGRTLGRPEALLPSVRSWPSAAWDIADAQRGGEGRQRERALGSVASWSRCTFVPPIAPCFSPSLYSLRQHIPL